jgi:hypothetical protein
LTLLWLAHLFSYAIKRTSGSKIVQSEAYSIDSDGPRRKFLKLFSSVLASALLGSMWSRPALAEGWGGCGGRCDKCSREYYENGGGIRCIDCHSCPGDDGQYNCTGQC